MAVETTEVEKLVGELEIAVDRLRSLYEQYFMGIEKLEPTVPRKDVDRRIHTLRKEQIRNTAQRFRFQMVLQRYNTYQTHWQRICREIENGTYKRHLLKANQRFADGRGQRPTTRRPPPPSSHPPPSSRPSLRALAQQTTGRPQAGAPLSPHVAAELAALDADFAAPPSSRAPGVARPPPPPRPGSPPRPPPLVRPPAASAPTLPHAPPPLIAPIPPRAPAPGSSRPPALAASPAARGPIAPGSPRPQGAPPGPTAGAAKPPHAAKPVAPAVKPIVAAQAPPTPGDLSDARVRQLYSEYVQARRNRNEPTAAVTYEAVARNLRESSAKLREKHGRSVDFEVSVKDGKTILKPVLKDK
ncbi:MAG TPA: MXAN_5187 C-terminal domain-containing protein [Polyangiaceae bacterium]|nr:MXAN_5187 C-terminal domain-containing protein [Polyangiaceae bacterium]